MATFQHTRVRFASPGVRVLEHVCTHADHVTPTPEPIADPVLGFIVQGAGELRVGRDNVYTDPTGIVLMNPGEAYSARHYGCRSRRCAATVHLDPTLLDAAMESFAVAPSRFLGRSAARTMPRSLRVQILLCRLLNGAGRADADGLDTEEAALELVQRTIAALHDWRVTTPHRTSELGLDVQRLIAERYAERLSLDRLAGEVGVSKFHLCRVFRASTGMTMASYLRRVRLAAAVRRLAEGERDLSRLAMDLGYSSHSHFTAVFRGTLGETPSSVREFLADGRG